MRIMIGFILGVLFAASVMEHRDEWEARQRSPNRTAPSLRRVVLTQ